MQLTYIVCLITLGLTFGTSPACANDTTITLQISFDAGAAKKLGELAEVASYFYGTPVKGGKIEADEMGRITAGSEVATIFPVDQTITVGGSLGGAPLDQLADLSLNLNIYSARIADENNILDCTFLDATLAELAASPQNVLCKLLIP